MYPERRIVQCWSTYRTDSYCHLPLYNVPNTAHSVTALPRPPHYNCLACNGSAFTFKLYWIKWNLLMKRTADTSPLGAARRLWVPSVLHVNYTGYITLSVEGLMEWWIGVVGSFKKNIHIFWMEGVRSGAVHWVTALQAGRLRVRFPMVSLELFIDLFLQSALCSGSRLSL